MSQSKSVNSNVFFFSPVLEAASRLSRNAANFLVNLDVRIQQLVVDADVLYQYHRQFTVPAAVERAFERKDQLQKQAGEKLEQLQAVAQEKAGEAQEKFVELKEVAQEKAGEAKEKIQELQARAKVQFDAHYQPFVVEAYQALYNVEDKALRAYYGVCNFCNDLPVRIDSVKSYVGHELQKALDKVKQALTLNKVEIFVIVNIIK